MEPWVSILIAVLGSLGTLVGAGGILTMVVSKKMDYKREDKIREENRPLKEIREQIGKITDDVAALSDMVQDSKVKQDEFCEDVRKTSKRQDRALQNILKESMCILNERCQNRPYPYATLMEKQNFESMYLSYHELGANGVMNQVHDQFMALPTTHKTPDLTKEDQRTFSTRPGVAGSEKEEEQ